MKSIIHQRINDEFTMLSVVTGEVDIGAVVMVVVVVMWFCGGSGPNRQLECVE